MNRKILKTISYLGLAVTLVPSILVYTGIINLDQNKTLALIGTLIWFGSAPFWINKQGKKK